MIPLDPSVVSSNPQFENFYKHVATALLEGDSDVSTKRVNAGYAGTEERLRERRVRRARERILVGALGDVGEGGEGTGLERDAREIASIMAAYIGVGIEGTGGRLSEDEQALMSDEVDSFRERMGAIVVAVEDELKRTYEDVKAIASITPQAEEKATTSRMPTRHAPQSISNSARLDDLIATQTKHLQTLRLTTLPTEIYNTTNLLISLLSLQASHLQQLIRNLELRVHGAESRHLVARAQFLSTVAQGLAGKSRVLYLERRREVYSPELRGELERRLRSIESEEKEVERRTKLLEGALSEYGKDGGDGDIMQKLGERYGDVEAELEYVKKDVERLEEEMKKKDSELRRPTKAKRAR